MKGQAKRKLADAIPHEAIVAIVGNKSRTWYPDLAHIDRLVRALLEAEAHIRVFGLFPFDRCVEEACWSYGALPEVWVDLPTEQRLRLTTRDEVMLDGVEIVVAFPREGEDLDSADPMVVTALELDIPVLVVHRKDPFALITLDNYIYS
jgi:hypothetical protein